ncbi:MAG: Fic family protein [Cytophagaceae bacterium]|jgi:Fic family protein|nr:Fic family protein [Cytophagaceae bacterium]
MSIPVYTFTLDFGFELLNAMSKIDRFGGAWMDTEKREGYKTLKELRSIATVNSVGASTRIEGSKMTNDEVKVLIENVKIEKLVERDQQEVLGYFNALDVIIESYRDISISESNIQNLHNMMMKFSDKDQWHKGNYKQLSNSVEANNQDGSKTTIFHTSAPGIETEDLMRQLIEWYNSDTATTPIIKVALFVYEFLSIHPFQDGNGRLSRLLGTLLLLKHDYSWIQYVSFEHEIERRKSDYYSILMECQQKRPGENITSWVHFFLECVLTIQDKLMQKLDVQKFENQMSPREKMIYLLIQNNPGIRSGEISEKLNIPLPTVKRILSEMTSGKFLRKYGSGVGTNYVADNLNKVQTDVAMILKNDDRKKEFVLKNKHSFLEIKKILLTPKFEWVKPSEWYNEVYKQNLLIKITCRNKGLQESWLPIAIVHYIQPTHVQPIFSLIKPIRIPGDFWEDMQDAKYPISVCVELFSDEKHPITFDMMLVYDASNEVAIFPF